MKINFLSKTDQNDRKFLKLLLIGLILRLVCAAVFQGFVSDSEYFNSWALMAAKSNLTHFYTDMKLTNQFVNYPPLYIYFLFIIGKVLNLLHLTKLTQLSIFILKQPAIWADLATTYLLYRLAKKHLSIKLRYLVAAFYFLHPIIWYDSAVWGQIDSLLALFIAAGFMLISLGKVELSTTMFVAAILTKPQGFFVLPILGFELLRQKKLSSLLWSAFYATLTVLIVALPFSSGFNLEWLFKLYLNTSNDFQYASVNAHNLFALFNGNMAADSKPFFFLTYRLWSYLLMTILISFVAYLYFKGRNENKIYSLAGLIMSYGSFMLLVRMHERYMFLTPVLILISFIEWQDKRLLRIYGGICLTGLLNLFLITDSIPVKILSSINLFLLGCLIKVSIDILLKGKIVRFDENIDTFKREILKFGKGK